ncbi:MAG: Protease HtpX-like protein [Candidatus Woesebacteria bacterium GW2011_GWB1_45_5]|uniref:Protease HtpX homolog n=1 Tax=Candidatus Woesebacteria bacterium GW2011_GWB1_45_5 TaxID=1618581 RepID=A0A0G1MMH8_9BACT|nr:MAG: Protease HtpX-like protein [Candidatus Woesebacteria bacterium GW2011_GWB1_45_5]
MKNIYEVQSANKIKSALIVALFLIFVFVSAYILASASGIYLGYEPGGLGFAGIALMVSGISTFVSYYFSDKIVLGISGARRANSKEDKLFTSVIENLCIGAGIPKPKLYVIEDSAPNAFATGRDPGHAVVCATTGLLSKLDRTELEGVMAHEISHIRNYDIRLMSIVSVMVGLVALLADWFLRMSWHGGRNRDKDDNQLGTLVLVLGLVFAVLSPIIAQLIQLVISRRREFTADGGSVELTRQPQGLIAALEKISLDHEPLEAANKATAHLYLVNPFKEKTGRAVEKLAGLFNTHPPISERIKALKAMS